MESILLNILVGLVGKRGQDPLDDALGGRAIVCELATVDGQIVRAIPAVHRGHHLAPATGGPRNSS